MSRRLLLVLCLMLVATACGPFGPEPTPTLTPQRLTDDGMQQAALAAVQDYAKRLIYEFRNPSFSIVADQGDLRVVHATVSFQTRKGFPYEDHDAIFNIRRTGGSWKADPIKTFSKLAWEVALERGPAVLNSGAGFIVTVPAGWVGYVAKRDDLKPANVCGIGAEPISGVPLLLAMPAGYSAENVPVILRGYQQCPKAPGLGVIRQRLEGVRDSDRSIAFQRLDVTFWAGQPALLAQLTDNTGAIVYDYYVMHRDRQLEFVIQAYPGQDLTTVLGMLNTIQFN